MRHCGTGFIETNRLKLRPFTLDDGDAMFRNWASDPAVTHYLTWPAHDKPETSRKIMQEWVLKYVDPSHYQWAIQLRENDEPFGCVSIVRIDESIPVAEIGYCIGRAWWGKGYMTESVRAVIDYLFQNTDVWRITARHDPRNAGSGKVMRKSGMLHEGTLRSADWNNQGVCDASCCAILRSDWEARRNQK